MFRSQRALFLSFSSGSDSSFVVAFLLRAVRPKTATRLRRQRPRWDGPIVPGTHLNQVHHCFPLDFYRPVRKFTCFTRCRVRRLNCRCVANFFKVLNTGFNWKLLEFFKKINSQCSRLIFEKNLKKAKFLSAKFVVWSRERKPIVCYCSKSTLLFILENVCWFSLGSCYGQSRGNKQVGRITREAKPRAACFVSSAQISL